MARARLASQEFFKSRHEHDRPALRRALDLFEVRLVYEEIGEKAVILTAPATGYYLDRRKEEHASTTQLFHVTAIVFVAETLVDMLLYILMARQEVNALRVTPRFDLQFFFMNAFGGGACYGNMRIADTLLG